MKSTRISTTKIAEICGVSQGTVDRALNNRAGINKNTKEKILSVAREYGYRPNIHARSIAGGKSHLIGVVIFDLKNQYFSDLLTQVEFYCNCLAYSTVVMFTDKDPQKEIQCIQDLYQLSVDGIVLCPSNSGEEYENFLLSLDIPVITFGNRLSKFPYVGINNTTAVRETVEYIAKEGYKKLIFVKPELKQKNIFAQKERLETFIEICKNVGIAYSITNLTDAESQIDSNERCAFICPTDIYAIKLLPIVKKHGAGIIGFDNVRLIDELGLVLDSVSYDVALTAKTAVDHIVNGAPVRDYIPHKIIKRGSI